MCRSLSFASLLRNPDGVFFPFYLAISPIQNNEIEEIDNSIIFQMPFTIVA